MPRTAPKSTVKVCGGGGALLTQRVCQIVVARPSIAAAAVFPRVVSSLSADTTQPARGSRIAGAVEQVELGHRGPGLAVDLAQRFQPHVACHAVAGLFAAELLHVGSHVGELGGRQRQAAVRADGRTERRGAAVVQVGCGRPGVAQRRRVQAGRARAPRRWPLEGLERADVAQAAATGTVAEVGTAVAADAAAREDRLARHGRRAVSTPVLLRHGLASKRFSEAT